MHHGDPLVGVTGCVRRREQTGKAAVSEGIGEARTEAEGELALARIAIDSGESAHAAAHAGNAIASDPTLRDAYQVLDQLAAGPDDIPALFPATARAYIGATAARSYLLARYGAVDEAFGLLCQVAASRPGQPWAVGWLAAPGGSAADFAGRMNPEQATDSLRQLAFTLTDPADEELAAPLGPFLAVARRIASLHPERADLLLLLSALARRLGAHDEAINWCERAERVAPSHSGAVMLGYALRSAGRLDEMHQAWLLALSRNQGNVDLRVDIAENLARRGRADEGIAWLDEGLALEPDHPKAFPSACAMRYRRDGDIAHLVQLADWWRQHPEHGYADQMLALACHRRPWLGTFPPPTEAIANLARNLAAREDFTKVGTMTLTLSALEVPSAFAAVRAALPGMTLKEDPPTPAPDIRVPLAEGRYRLWTYDGVRAVPAVPAPSPAAVSTLRSAAAAGYPSHPLMAYDMAVALSGLPVADLRGLMAHVPPPPDAPPWQRMHRADPTAWPRAAQAWACLGLLHHHADEPWLTSTRRAVLVDLVRGIEDWATDAAMNALVTAAWADPEIRGDVVGLIGHRFMEGLTAYQKREVTIIKPMAYLVLATPAMPVEVTALAREFLQRMEAQDEPPAGQPPAEGGQADGKAGTGKPRRGLFGRR
jgi:tetratricopeptide (TPR) repeat protein